MLRHDSIKLVFLRQSASESEPKESKVEIPARREKGQWHLFRCFDGRHPLNRDADIEAVELFVEDNGKKIIRVHGKEYATWDDWEWTNGRYKVWLELDPPCPLPRARR